MTDQPDINELKWVFWWHPLGHKWRDTTPESLYHFIRDDGLTACGREIGSSHRAYTDRVDNLHPSLVCKTCARKCRISAI